jgi:4-hydroxybenzoate polyprenyltransferase
MIARGFSAALQSIFSRGRIARQSAPLLRQRLRLYARLARLDRPIGIFLLLWPTLWALWVAAGGIPSLHLILVFTFGVLLTRSAGCVINDYADRNFDRHVARTRDRPLTTGQVTGLEAYYLLLAMLTAALLLVVTTNRLTILLAFAAIPLGGCYPFMKRYTYLPQFFMGLAFGWGIPMAFAAQTGTVPPIAWLLFIANILYAMIYDTIYAMVDREYDMKIGIKSAAILFADADRHIIGIMQAMLLAVLFLAGRKADLGVWYNSSLGIVMGLCVYHQSLIRKRLPEDCFRAFLHNNWIGAAVFAGIVIDYVLKY